MSECYCTNPDKYGHQQYCLVGQIYDLKALLTRYMWAYPAFHMMPVGMPGSPARIEQERLMALEMEAQEATIGFRFTGDHP
jgi:hypothetical protein